MKRKQDRAMKKNRRTVEGYKLRVYIDAIKQARMTTDAEWIEGWASGPSDCAYMPKIVWVSYLERCAIEEAGKLMEQEAA